MRRKANVALTDGEPGEPEGKFYVRQKPGASHTSTTTSRIKAARMKRGHEEPDLASCAYLRMMPIIDETKHGWVPQEATWR